MTVPYIFNIIVKTSKHSFVYYLFRSANFNFIKTFFLKTFEKYYRYLLQKYIQKNIVFPS